VPPPWGRYVGRRLEVFVGLGVITTMDSPRASWTSRSATLRRRAAAAERKRAGTSDDHMAHAVLAGKAEDRIDDILAAEGKDHRPN